MEKTRADKINDWEYDIGFDVKYVNYKGYAILDGEQYFIGEGLACKQIAVKHSNSHEHCVDLFFREFKIGRLNLQTKKIEWLRVYRIENDPRDKRLI